MTTKSIFMRNSNFEKRAEEFLYKYTPIQIYRSLEIIYSEIAMF